MIGALQKLFAFLLDQIPQADPVGGLQAVFDTSQKELGGLDANIAFQQDFFDLSPLLGLQGLCRRLAEKLAESSEE